MVIAEPPRPEISFEERCKKGRQVETLTDLLHHHNAASQWVTRMYERAHPDMTALEFAKMLTSHADGEVRRLGALVRELEAELEVDDDPDEDVRRVW